MLPTFSHTKATFGTTEPFLRYCLLDFHLLGVVRVNYRMANLIQLLCFVFMHFRHGKIPHTKMQTPVAVATTTPSMSVKSAARYNTGSSFLNHCGHQFTVIANLTFCCNEKRISIARIELQTNPRPPPLGVFPR